MSPRSGDELVIYLVVRRRLACKGVEAHRIVVVSDRVNTTRFDETQTSTGFQCSRQWSYRICIAQPLHAKLRWIRVDWIGVKVAFHFVISALKQTS